MAKTRQARGRLSNASVKASFTLGFVPQRGCINRGGASQVTEGYSLSPRHDATSKGSQVSHEAGQDDRQARAGETGR
jgi:hypothetical protein